MCSTGYIDINYPLQSFRYSTIIMIIIVISDTDTYIEKQSNIGPVHSITE